MVLFGVFYAARFLIPFIYEDLRNFLAYILELIEEREPVSNQLLYRVIWLSVKMALPLLLITMFLGVMASLVQTRFNISFKLLSPKLSNLSPTKGLGRIFSKRNLVELIKNIIKILILISFLYSILKADIIPISKMIHMDIKNSSITLMSMMFDLITRICAVFLAIAFFDFMYQKWQYEMDLRMTKQEVKDQAPIVLAKGQDELALKIVAVGEEHHVTAIENKPLARAMYPVCKVGKEIPGDFYGAVAEILVYIYRKENRQDILEKAKEDNRNA